MKNTLSRLASMGVRRTDAHRCLRAFSAEFSHSSLTDNWWYCHWFIVVISGRRGQERFSQWDMGVFTLWDLFQFGPTPIEKWDAPNFCGISERQRLQTPIIQTPNYRAMAFVISCRAAALIYLEDKKSFLGAKCSDPSNPVDRNRHSGEWTSRNKRHNQDISFWLCNKAPSGAASSFF